MKRIELILFLSLLLGGCRFFKGDPYRNTPTTGKTSICVDETFRPIIEAELDVDEKNIYFIKLEKKNCSIIITKDIPRTKNPNPFFSLAPSIFLFK